MILDSPVDRLFSLLNPPMNFYIFSFDQAHLFGESATHSIEPLAMRLDALLLLAGSSLLRRRAYPATPPAAYSGASN